MTRKKALQGKIFLHLEQGSEGFSLMSFVEDNKIGWEGFNMVEKGDYIIVYNPDKSIAFSGKIDPVQKAQVFRSLGVAVVWTQKGCKPLDWVKLFTHEPALRASLRKK